MAVSCRHVMETKKNVDVLSRKASQAHIGLQGEPDENRKEIDSFNYRGSSLLISILY